MRREQVPFLDRHCQREKAYLLPGLGNKRVNHILYCGICGQSDSWRSMPPHETTPFYPEGGRSPLTINF